MGILNKGNNLDNYEENEGIPEDINGGIWYMATPALIIISALFVIWILWKIF